MTTTLVNGKFTCSVCNRELPISHSGAIGYARNIEGKLLCYDCCAKDDAASMISTGLFTGYITAGPNNDPPAEVTNWCGTLHFLVDHQKSSRHNIGRWRVDAWFTGPDGAMWHGVNIGDNQILRCKRLKKQKKDITPLKEETYLKPYSYVR